MDFNNIWSDIDLKSQKQNTRCLSVNTILAGKYLVGPVLGQGGFGITYLGYDLNMETRIAIKEYFPVELVSRDTTMHGDKVLSLSGEKSQTYQQGLKKYVAEAQNVSQFADVPGVVSVKDFFYENETAYIVMEYIDGISLKDYLKEKGGRLSEEETLAIMKPVLEALEKVHNAGIIHRDISPDNIMLTFEESAGAPGGRFTLQSQSMPGGQHASQSQTALSGQSAPRSQSAPGGQSAPQSKSVPGLRPIKSVKLIDFGAARMTAKNDQKSLTIILKHGYAPEEQYRTHGEQGPWTDVYAVCAVMYRMLTGQTPVPAMDRMFKDELKNFEELGFAVKEGIPQSAAAGTCRVSTGTAAAIMKGLAVKKDDRIQNMRDLIAVLYEGAKVAGSKADAKKKELIIGLGAAATVFVVVLAVVVAVWMKNISGSQNQGAAEDLLASANASTESTEVLEEAGSNAEDAGETEASAAEEVIVDMGTAEEVLGEQIVFYHPQRSICSSGYHVLFCMQDGTVQARGENSNGECEVEDWTHVAAVAAGYHSSFGLRTDGTVLYTGQDELKEVERWTDIVDIQAWQQGALGLKKDGTVICCLASEWYAQEYSDMVNTISEWTGIKAIAAAEEVVFGLQTDGTVLCAGGETTYNITGWEDVEYLVTDTYYGTNSLLAGLCSDGSIKAVELREKDDKTYLNNMLSGTQVVQLDSRIMVHQDGTVSLIAKDDYVSYKEELQQTVEDWTDVQAAVMFSGQTEYYYALKTDGTILYSVPNMGNASLEEMTNLEWIRLIESGGCENLIAYTKDGKVLAYGSVSDMSALVSSMCEDDSYEERVALGMELGMVAQESSAEAIEKMNELSEEAGYQIDISVEHYETGWTAPQYYAEICSAAAKIMYFDQYFLLQKDGTVVFKNGVKKETYRNVKQAFYSPKTVLYQDGTVEVVDKERLNDKERYQTVDQWTNVVQMAEYNNNFYALMTDGTVINDNGVKIYGPDEEKEAEDGGDAGSKIVELTGSDDVLFGITEEGSVVVLNHSESAAERGMLQVEGWKNVVSIAVGRLHTVGLLADGTVVATGKNNEGQCDVEEWANVVSITAGAASTLGITEDGNLLIAGQLY